MPNGYFNNFQSGFRANHSTKTALIKALNDMHLYTNTSKTSVLVVLDFSAAFDTVHKILLPRLELWVGFSGTVVNWLS